MQRQRGGSDAQAHGLVYRHLVQQAEDDRRRQLTAAIIFGLLNEVPVDEAMRLGITAASLTLQTVETVVPSLNQELLYNRLAL